MPLLTSLRLASLAMTAAAAIVLTGCSQVSEVVDQIMPDDGAHVLVVGECFNNTVRILTSEDAIIDVPRENCTLAHDNEVIASVQLEGEKFPGDDAVLLDGFAACLPEFEQFIGVSFDEAGTLAYDFFAPSEASWALGDREVLCFAFDSEAQTEYSLKGQGAERAAAAPGTDGEAEVETEGDS